jgi:hypothetical protein
MASLPTDFSAIESNNFSYLFYIRNGGTISFLRSDTTHEGAKTVYTSSSIKLSANLVNTSSSRISAVSYNLNGKREVSLVHNYLLRIGGGDSCGGIFFQLR